MKRQHWFLCLAMFCILASCDEKKNEICEVAINFSKHYYNLNIKKAKEYCHPDIYGIMDFRAHNIRDIDRELHQKSDSAKVSVISYHMDYDKNSAYVDVEVRNFIRVNYIHEYVHVVPCDTFQLVLVNEFNTGWVVRHPS